LLLGASLEANVAERTYVWGLQSPLGLQPRG